MKPGKISPREPFDSGSIIVIVVTLILFAAALFVKGMTHDMLLEAAVFLVSVKLILNGYKNTVAFNALTVKLNEIHDLVHASKELVEHLGSDRPRS